jgi:hypothetical protein
MPKRGIVLIDFKYEYSPGGGFELVGPEAVATRAVYAAFAFFGVRMLGTGAWAREPEA